MNPESLFKEEEPRNQGGCLPRRDTWVQPHDGAIAGRVGLNQLILVISISTEIEINIDGLHFEINIYDNEKVISLYKYILWQFTLIFPFKYFKIDKIIIFTNV